MKTTSEQHFDYTIKANNIPERVTDDNKITFRKITIYGVSAAPTNGLLADNVNDLFLGLMGDGRKVFTNKIAASPAGVCDANVVSYTVPDSLPEMKLSDLWIYGTATDGVFISYISGHPEESNVH